MTERTNQKSWAESVPLLCRSFSHEENCAVLSDARRGPALLAVRLDVRGTRARGALALFNLC